MPLPFKQWPYLPDIRELAIVRLNHLNRMSSKNERYKTDYIMYMDHIIDIGDVETMNNNGTNGENGTYLIITLPPKKKARQATHRV